MHNFGTIGVLMGGCSSERAVSLRSGEAVAHVLSQQGHRLRLLDITSEDKNKIIAQIKETPLDIVFIALHGRLGEDGGIQSILEDLDIPYIGSGVQASQLCFNKMLTRKALRGVDVPMAEAYIITDGKYIEFKAVWNQLKSTPLVVKPACEGSSIGVHVVRHPSEWETALKEAFNYGPQVIIEQFIKGRELTVGIFDKEVLPLVEIRPPAYFFSYAAKYQKGATIYECPAAIPDDINKKVKAMAYRAYEVLGCEGFARVDLILDEAQRPFILEVNTIPGFTGTSLFPKAAKAAGYTFESLCEKLLGLAYDKEKQH